MCVCVGGCWLQVAIVTAMSDQACGVVPMLALDDILLVNDMPCQQATASEAQKSKFVQHCTD